MRRASPTGTGTPADPGRRWTAKGIAGAAAGAAAVGFGGLYAAGLLLAGEDVPEGTKVRGVSIGGMSRDEARRTLDRELGPAAAAPVALRIGERTEQADPGALGLSVDSAATADRAARTGSGPLTVIGRLFASGDPGLAPVVRLDEKTARGALEDLGRKTGVEAKEGSVSFEKGRAKAVAPVTGITLDVDASLDTLLDGYPRTGTDPLALPVRRTEPKVGQQETDRALKEFAEPAMSAPVTLAVAGRNISLSPTVLSRHLRLGDGGGGRLTPGLDTKALLADPALAGPLRQAAPGPAEARLRLDAAGRVTVAQEGRAGRQVTEQALGAAVLPLLTGADPAARTGEVATEAAAPRLSKDTVDQLGLKEKVSSFTVRFEPAAYRTTNIGRAAELINGSLVLPDETWSFNRTVGERTKENGFVDGLIINNGQYEKAAGGGVSAVATTVFNAMFFAGVKPVEYGAHSFYIERYPEGREATVAWGSLDLRFVNDSGKALYLQAEATDTSITITFLGTKKYEEIRANQGPRTNIKQPATRTGSGPKCEPQTPLEGFDVAVDRVFVQGGKEVKRETMKTRYTPRDHVKCGA
ncbi:VanW family protein [Streptomyces avidinii]|uniref:Vancomycin resistance protein YoaR n=1 Tax=Streptomyces avidinii TaxID=1895 RepID=A0ABS4L4R0_STRAV|nr:VanW family protein [Streptomyces avidinii]MBP2037099.1 vancomycin resistance protein YoaR [Streptomyces avidinii]GGY95169.1 VanW family protein [Streptomyces avidinii]